MNQEVKRWVKGKDGFELENEIDKGVNDLVEVRNVKHLEEVWEVWVKEGFGSRWWCFR